MENKPQVTTKKQRATECEFSINNRMHRHHRNNQQHNNMTAKTTFSCCFRHKVVVGGYLCYYLQLIRVV
ncbi:MAG TPA: hypothetical protein V6C97_05630 [Oculatellaceae cyanobacterium]